MLSRLQEISCGDSDLRLELVDLFVASVDSRLSFLRTAIDTGDAVATEIEAHTIKGASRHLGADSLGSIAAGLEAAGKSGDLTEAPGLLKSLGEEFTRVRAFLERLSHEGSDR